MRAFTSLTKESTLLQQSRLQKFLGPDTYLCPEDDGKGRLSLASTLDDEGGLLVPGDMACGRRLTRPSTHEPKDDDSTDCTEEGEEAQQPQDNLSQLDGEHEEGAEEQESEGQGATSEEEEEEEELDDLFSAGSTGRMERLPSLSFHEKVTDFEELAMAISNNAFSRQVTPLEDFSFASSSWQRHVTATAEPSPDDWMAKGETLIMFDWDDTLCPTSFMRTDPNLTVDEVACCFLRTPEELEREPELARMKALLEKHTAAVRELLTSASRVGCVTIVTLATPEWVEDSIRRFMPGLGGLLTELNVQVVHARDAGKGVRRPSFVEGRDYGQVLKTQAMAWVTSHFYGTGRRGNKARSWKNILSIGDSDSERYALQDVVFRRTQTDRQGNWRECRCKTLKLVDEPTLEQLTGQLKVLVSWLAFIAQHDGDVDIDFGEVLQSTPPETQSAAESWNCPSSIPC